MDKDGSWTTNRYFYKPHFGSDFDSDRGKYERDTWEATLDNTDSVIAEIVDSGLFEVSGIAGQSLATFNLCCLKSDGKYYKSCAASTAYMPGLVIASQKLSASQTGTFYRRGIVTNNSWSWATANFVYASRTTGLMSQTLATISGSQVQVVGIAKTAKILDFDPQLILIEVS
jgi:hypothetical protein